MKISATLALAFLVQFVAFGQTLISTPTVSGTWNLAGSPYIIQNQIEVAAGASLTIEPGVIVRFQPTTRMMIFGQMIAVGTAAAPIVFEATDTTSWSDEYTTNGGWSGIHYRPYGGSGIDNSAFKYCTVKDVKYGYPSVLSYANTFTVNRDLDIHNCTFRHNNNGTAFYAAGQMVSVQTFQASDTVDFYHCDFTENICETGLIYLCGVPTGYASVRSCHIYENDRGSGIMTASANALIEDNEIDNNTAVYNSAPIYAVGNNVLIRRNRIHHNVSENYGAISCNYGLITVEQNLICNNIQTLSTCGFDQGGGGIHLSTYGTNVNDGFYIVRNNVIANNHGALAGGGIYAYQAIACVSNNHIINNSTPIYGSAMCVSGFDSQIYVRNNLFYAQSAPGAPLTENLIHMYNGSSLWFDYNLIPSNYSQAVKTYNSYTLYGDTINNVINPNHGLAGMTANDYYLTDATSTNFAPLSTSPCINQGDTVGAFPALIDYLGNNRFIGTIDIGAFEYQQSGVGLDALSKDEGLLIYPNPGNAEQGITVVSSKMGELVLYDMQGHVMYRQPIQSGTQTIHPQVAAGMYFVKLSGESATVKLTIE